SRRRPSGRGAWTSTSAGPEQLQIAAWQSGSLHTMGRMEATRIIAVRHGETSWNVDARIQGQLDIQLNDTGRWQARRVGHALSSAQLAAIYSSDLGRAHETARAIGDAAGIPVQPHPGLRE